VQLLGANLCITQSASYWKTDAYKFEKSIRPTFAQKVAQREKLGKSNLRTKNHLDAKNIWEHGESYDQLFTGRG
jgi:hypothetical protein